MKNKFYAIETIGAHDKIEYKTCEIVSFQPLVLKYNDTTFEVEWKMITCHKDVQDIIRKEYPEDFI